MKKAIEETLPSLVDEAVKKAVADLKVSEQIASRVSAEIDSRQAEFASLLYRTYKESLVEELTKEIIERTKQAEQEEIAKSVSESEKQTAEYEAQRTAVREAMISSLLSKLED